MPAEPVADALQAWLDAAGQSGGLAADFATTATAAAWRDGAIEVTIPTAHAISFLSRSEVAGGITKALTEVAGRQVSIRLVAGAAATTGPAADAVAADAPASRHTATSQVALVREAAEHPLVAHARQVFDAAIRRVDPPRERPVRGGDVGADSGVPEPAAAEEADVAVHAAGEDADG